MEKKRLYRTEGSYKMICGVCGGLAEYFDVDPTLVRVGWAVVSCFTLSAGLWAYLICSFIIPRKSTIYPDL